MKVLGGRQIVVQFARGPIQHKSSGYGPSNTLFIGSIPYEFTDRDLQDLFKDVFNVVDVRIPVDRRSGMLRGFAHAEFLNEQAAARAMAVLQNKTPYGRKLRVDFSIRKKSGLTHAERLPKMRPVTAAKKAGAEITNEAEARQEEYAATDSQETLVAEENNASQTAKATREGATTGKE